MLESIERRNDTQLNDTQHNDTQHNNKDHKALNTAKLSVVYPESR
jgi:hypothetical protein